MRQFGPTFAHIITNTQLDFYSCIVVLLSLALSQVKLILFNEQVGKIYLLLNAGDLKFGKPSQCSCRQTSWKSLD